jgi:HEAT repeat protein
MLALTSAIRPCDDSLSHNQSGSPKKQAETAVGKSVAELIEILKLGDNEVRTDACRALVAFGPKARPALPALIEALEDRDQDIRGSAAHAIGAIGPRAAAAVPKLIKALRDDDASVRGWAAHSLGKIGPKARSAVPSLIELLKDKEPGVRADAASALGDIGWKSAVVVPALAAALKHEATPCRYYGSMAFYAGPDVKRVIARSLSRFGQRAVPVLTNLLEHPSKEVRWCALYALGEMGWAAKGVADAVGKRLQDKEEVICKQAVRTLVLVEPVPERLIGPLMKALKSKRGGVRYAAAESLGELGPKARAAVPLLVRVYEANDIEIGGAHWVVGLALKRIDPEAARRAGVE